MNNKPFFQRKDHSDLLEEYEELKPHQTNKRKFGTAVTDGRANT